MSPSTSPSTDSEIERQILKIQHEAHIKYQRENMRYASAKASTERSGIRLYVRKEGLGSKGRFGARNTKVAQRRHAAIARSDSSLRQNNHEERNAASLSPSRKRKSMQPLSTGVDSHETVSQQVATHKTKGSNFSSQKLHINNKRLLPPSYSFAEDEAMSDLSSSIDHFHSEFVNSHFSNSGRISNVSNEDSALSSAEENVESPKFSTSQKADIALLNQIIAACHNVTHPPRKPSDTFKTYLLLHLKQNEALKAYLACCSIGGRDILEDKDLSPVMKQKGHRRIQAYAKQLANLYSSRDMKLITNELEDIKQNVLRKTKRRTNGASPSLYRSLSPVREAPQEVVGEKSWQSREPAIQRSSRALPPPKGSWHKSPSNVFGAPSPVPKVDKEGSYHRVNTLASPQKQLNRENEFSEDRYLDHLLLETQQGKKIFSDAPVLESLRPRTVSQSPPPAVDENEAADRNSDNSAQKEIQPGIENTNSQSKIAQHAHCDESLEESRSESLEREYLEQSPIANHQSTFTTTQPLRLRMSNEDLLTKTMAAFSELKKDLVAQIASLRDEIKTQGELQTCTELPIVSSDSTIDIPSMLSSTLLSQKLEEQGLRDSPACTSRRIAPHEKFWSSASHKLSYLHKNPSFQYLLRLCNLEPMSTQDLYLQYFGANRKHVLLFQCTLKRITTQLKHNDLSMHKDRSNMDDSLRSLVEQLCLLEQQLHTVDGFIPQSRNRMNAGLIAPAFSNMTRKEKSKLLQVVFESWGESLPLCSWLHKQGRFILLGVGLVFL